MLTPLQKLKENICVTPYDFDQQGKIHGLAHTVRVMTYVYILAEKLKMEREGALAYCAAFLHDAARKHDAICRVHGKWSAEHKLPVYEEQFYQHGIQRKDRDELRVAIAWHSSEQELDRNHPYSRTVALLKDADALDRFRISEDDLDVKFLRFRTSLDLIGFARALVYETRHMDTLTVDQCLELRHEFPELNSRVPGPDTANQPTPGLLQKMLGKVFSS